LSDIDGVIRKLYDALYKSYQDDMIYNEYVAYAKSQTPQENTPMSYEEFLNIIYNPDKQSNVDLITSLIEKHPEVYAIARADEKIIWVYNELISSNMVNHIVFVTTYINDHIANATQWWLHKHLKMSPDKWHALHCRDGKTKKILPEDVIKSDEVFIIVEDLENIGNDMAKQITEYHRLAKVIVVNDKISSMAIEIIRTALELYKVQYGHEFGRN